MVTQEQAFKQITRLAQYGKVFTDMRDEGVGELVQALKLGCLNAHHAERVIDTWTRQNRWMPTVADLYQTAEAVQDRPDPPSDRFQCQKCRGTGWRVIYALTTKREGPSEPEIKIITKETYEALQHTVDWNHQRVDSGVTGCDCVYGCHLANARYVEKQKQLAEMGEQPKSGRKLKGL